MKARLRLASTYSTGSGRDVVEIRVDSDGIATIATCPACKASPARVGGAGITGNDHDHYFADGRCMVCDAPIGIIETKISTIFGIDEDEAVLEGRPRVY